MSDADSQLGQEVPELDDQHHTAGEAYHASEMDLDFNKLSSEVHTQLEEQGWGSERIAEWQATNAAAMHAMSKGGSRCQVTTTPEGLAQESGPRPGVLLMLDDGTFITLVGTNAAHLAVNIREIDP